MAFPDGGFAGQTPNATNLDQSVIFQKANFAAFPAASGLAEGTRFMDASTGDIYRVESSTWVKKTTAGQSGDMLYDVNDGSGIPADNTFANYTTDRSKHDMSSDPFTQNDTKISVSGGVATITVTEDSTNDAGIIDKSAYFASGDQYARIDFDYKVTTQGNPRTVYLGMSSANQATAANAAQYFIGLRHIVNTTDTIAIICTNNAAPDSASAIDSKPFAATTNTQYYVTIEWFYQRRYTVTVYSDAARTNVVVSCSGTTNNGNTTPITYFKYMNKIVTNAGTAVVVLDNLRFSKEIPVPKSWYLVGKAARWVDTGKVHYRCPSNPNTDRLHTPVTFSANWTFDFEFTPDAYGGNNNDAGVITFSNGILHPLTGNPQYSIVCLIASGAANAGKLSIYEVVNGSVVTSNSRFGSALSAGTKYYMRFTKTSDTGYTLTAYTDSGRTATYSTGSITAANAKTYGQFTYLQMAHTDGGNTNTIIMDLENFVCSQATISGGTIAQSLAKPYYIFDFGSAPSNNLASFAINMWKAQTSATQVTLYKINADGTQTAIRYINVSDFTENTNRFVSVNKHTPLQFYTLGINVRLNDFSYLTKTDAQVGASHIHKKLSGILVEINVDRN